MKLREHSIISASAAGAAYLATGSFGLASGILLSGIFLDLDHIYNYFMCVGIKLDIKDLFDKCDRYQLRKFIVPLHSYELVAVFALLFYLTSSRFWLGILAGSVIHLSADLYYNRVYLLSYSFIYRCIKNFDGDVLFKPPYGKNKNP